MVYRVVGALLHRAVDVLYREPGLDAVVSTLLATYFTVGPAAPSAWASLG